MHIELPDEVIESLREALTPLLDRLIDERVEQRRPLLLTVTEVAGELNCSRASVFGLIHGGNLEAIRMGRTYRVATATLVRYVGELAKLPAEREVVSARNERTSPPRRSAPDLTKPRPASLVSALPATNRPRVPRPKQVKVSKQDVVESRFTVAELADRWWGMESARALLDRSGIELTNDTDGHDRFRYGDLVEWMEGNRDQFDQWVTEFDPHLKRRTERPSGAP